jgi:hypothetical protein
VGTSTPWDDLHLTKAFVRCSPDPIKACDQPAADFWSQISEVFHELQRKEVPAGKRVERTQNGTADYVDQPATEPMGKTTRESREYGKVGGTFG